MSLNDDENTQQPLDTECESVLHIGCDNPTEPSAAQVIHQLIEKVENRNSLLNHEEIMDITGLPRKRSFKISNKKSKDKIHDEITATSSSTSSNYDICRICHMGGSTPNQNNCVTPGSDVDESQRTTPGNGRLNARTSSANFDLGLLISACRCRGTVGLVHTKCLERWLTESGHTSCELCGYRYATIRVPRHGIFRSLVIWLKTFVATRQMLLDSLYLVVTTPLALFSAYVCAMTLKMALENRVGDIPWTIVAMLPTCSLTLVAYWGWLLTLQRLHGRRWRRYWQDNFTVRLVPGVGVRDSDTSEDDTYQEQDYYYDDAPDFFNLLG